MELIDWECDVCGLSAKIPDSGKEPVHNCKMRGLGDLVAKGLKSVGITKKRAARAKQVLTGKDEAECNCKGRQSWLNRLWSFNGDDREVAETDLVLPYFDEYDCLDLEREGVKRWGGKWHAERWEVTSDLSHIKFFDKAVATERRDIEYIYHYPLLITEKRLRYNLFGVVLYDIDGIFVEDIYPNGEHDWHEEVLRDAPRTAFVPPDDRLVLVTGRTQDLHDVTWEWFENEPVAIKDIHFYPGGKGEWDKHAAFKASVYNEMEERHFFVESDLGQAEEIYDLTRKTVICPAAKKVFTNMQAIENYRKLGKEGQD